MTASPCARCGTPVLPDRQAAGFWVDRWNGRFCGGDQRFPHQAASRGPVPWIITGCVAAVAVLLGAAVLVIVLNGGQRDDPAAGQAARTWAPDATPAPKPSVTRAPEAPVPCDPALERGFSCFPAAYQGPALLRRIAKAMKWTCYRAGQKDRSGTKLRNAECQGVNTVDQPYTRRVSLGYEAPPNKDDGTMKEVVIVASTQAVNQGTTVKNTTRLGTDAFDIAVTHLWPANKALRKEANRALAKLQRDCAPSGMSEKVRLSVGYDISCSVPTPISVRHDDGEVVTTITQILRIDAPIDAYGD
ncbi:hypothetical protein SAMN05444920_107325 [Nonomuraea solani]|uniref:Uncharacterized protein n=1 Tax=Nonomuraea solani TaxID=1144553 RepID=A0A1H6E229_9ACTN|nr:hypothetical protein [Nonomuraea solani]SEG91670.1 hypothetical protein SAMN05444920_107325 [Nonomuraea solani]